MSDTNSKMVVPLSNGDSQRDVVEVLGTDLEVLSRERLHMMMEQRKLFLEFVKNQMLEGIDYGRFGGAKKDTLLKAGAEKLCSLFGLGHKIVKEEDTIDRENNFTMASRTVAVYSLRSGITRAECQGSMNSLEPQHRNKNPFAILNTLQKMAFKRAFVGAVISATSAAEIFTQDLEDSPDDFSVRREGERVAPKQTTNDSRSKPSPAINRLLEVAKECQWDREDMRTFSKKQFGKADSRDLTDGEIELFCKNMKANRGPFPELINEG